MTLHHVFARKFVRLAFAASAFIALQSAANFAYAAPVQILAPATTATAKSRMPVDGIKSATTPIAFNAAALHAMAKGEEAMLSLPNGQQYMVVALNVVQHADGNVGWVGTLKDFGKRYKIIATTGPAGTYGAIETPHEDWSIVPGKGAGHDFLLSATRESELNPTPADADDAVISPRTPFERMGYANTHTNIVAAIEPKVFNENYLQQLRLGEMQLDEMQLGEMAENNVTKATPRRQRTIDVMVVVTQGFANFHGSALETRIAQAFNTTNAAYATSEVAIRINKVGATVIRNYGDTSPNKSDALRDVTNNNGVFSGLESTRTSVGADLVVFLRNVNDGGIAWLGQINNIGGQESWGNPRYMYGVVGVCNFTGCDSVFAHELGHNMGLQHNRENAGGSDGIRPYAYGWRITSGNAARDFRTIMSYAPPNNRVLVFSNPNLFICNPSGFSPPDACGVANSADNARTLNENRRMLSNIKAATGALVTP